MGHAGRSSFRGPVAFGLIKHETGTVVYRSPGARQGFRLSGVTRDSAGTVLANCRVELFITSSDVKVAEVVSGSDGSFSFDNPGTGPFYLVGYKAGPPDVAATSVNNLTAGVI